MDTRLLPYAPERDVYRLLGVDPRAGADEIVVACRRLARTFHPDRNASQRAHEEMQVVNAVRELLTDPRTRAEYDHARWRFWATSGADRGEDPLARWHPELRWRRGESTPPNAWTRHVSAIWRGVRAAAAALGPPRCVGCRTVVAEGDRYCAACGRRLLGMGAGTG